MKKRYNFLMRILRAILPVFAVFAVCAAGEARAVDGESAQAQNRPASLGDIRQFESRMDERMDRLESRMDDRMRHLEGRMMQMESHMLQMFITMIMVMLALFGAPHFPGWWNRLRANGKSAVAAGVFFVALVVITAGAAIAAV